MRAREFQRVFQRLVAAQARTDDQQRVATAVEALHGRVQVVGPQRLRVVLGHDAAPLGAGDHAEAQPQQALHRGPGMARAAA